MLRQIVLPYGYGQTCNQLFQISHWIPTASELGIPLYFPGFRRYAQLFSGTFDLRQPRFPRTAPAMGLTQAALSLMCTNARRAYLVSTLARFIHWRRMVPGVVTFVVDDSGLDGSIDPNKVIGILALPPGSRCGFEDGCTEIEPAWQNIRNVSRSISLRFRRFNMRVDACIRKNRQENTVLVGVHLRRGDYSEFAGGKYYTTTTPLWADAANVEALAGSQRPLSPGVRSAGRCGTTTMDSIWPLGPGQSGRRFVFSGGM